MTAALTPMAVALGGGNVPTGGAAAVAPFSDATALVKNSGDATKLFRVNAAPLGSGVTRTVTPPAADGQLATTGDLDALADLLTLQQGNSVSESYDVPADTLDADGVALTLTARGDFGGGAALRCTVGGTVLVWPGTAGELSPEGEGTWEIVCDVVRQSATSVVVSARAVIQGQDADVGSNLETWVLPRQVIAVSDLAASVLSLVIDYNSADASRLVNWLMVRRVGLGSAASGSVASTDLIDAVGLPSPALLLDAGDSTSLTLTGALVDQLDDRTGYGRHVTAAGAERPSLVATALNGRDALEFDGAATVLTNATGLFSGLSGEVWCVFQLNATGVAHVLWCSADAASSTRYIGAYVGGGDNKVHLQQRNDDVADDLTADTTTLVAGQIYIVRVTSGPNADGTLNAVEINGVPQTMVAGAGANSGDWFGDTLGRDSFTIGAQSIGGTTSGYADMLLGELAVFEEAMFAGAKRLMRLLARKYGVTLP